MSNPPRQKGTRAESAVKRWLCDELGINVDRSPLRGTKDCGDIVGLPDTVVEVKNTKLPDPKGWARELAAEMRNAGCSQGVVLWSPPGVGMSKVDQWVAFTPLVSNPFVWHAAPHLGALARLHKYVDGMAEWSCCVAVGDLVAEPAWRWLMTWRERNLHRIGGVA